MEAGRPAEALRALQRSYPLPRGWIASVPVNALAEWSPAARSVRLQRNGLLYAGGRDWFTQTAAGLHLDDQVNANPAGGQYVLRRTATHTALVAPRPHAGLPDRPAALIGSAGNYYHWLLDYLPRLPLVAGDLPLVVGDRLAGFERDSLAALGVLDRVIGLPRQTVTRFGRLHVPDLGSMERRPHPDAVDWLRSTFGGRAGPHRRLWITRASAPTRRLTNEAAVVEALAPLGFTVVQLDGMDIRDQATLFGGADVIAGPHGAGFANAVFCRPGAVLLEVVPGTRPIFFTALAGALGLRHQFLDARPVPNPATDPRDWDMVATPAAVVAAVKAL